MQMTALYSSIYTAAFATSRFGQLLAQLRSTDIPALQLRKLQEIVQFHYAHNPVYRAKCQERGVRPEHIQSLGDLHLLPIIERDYLNAHPFFPEVGKEAGGSVPASELGTFLNSSGSTGSPKRIPIAQRAIPSIFETSALGMWMGGVRGYQKENGGPILPIFPHGPFPGSFFIQNGAEQIGFCPKSDMGMPFEWHYRNLVDLGAKYIITSPSFISAFANFIEQDGDFAAFDLDRILLGGEYLSDSLRAQIELKFNAKVRDIYGCGETQVVGVESDDLRRDHPGYLHHLAHMSFIEVVEPGTDKPLPRGEQGEMLITVFNRYAWPVIRYRMGDIVTLPEQGEDTGELGLPLMSRIMGRADDMLIYGNVNLYPETFFQAIKAYNQHHPQSQLSIDKFQFVLDEDEAGRARASLSVESADRTLADPGAAGRLLHCLVKQNTELEHALYTGKQVPPPQIDILPPGALYFKEQKLRRLQDKRKRA